VSRKNNNLKSVCVELTVNACHAPHLRTTNGKSNIKIIYFQKETWKECSCCCYVHDLKSKSIW